jgi:hypothetical protein
MADIKLAVMNKSTVLTNAQVQAIVDPLQIQVHRDFAPVWGTDADLTFVPSGDTPDPGSWWLTVFDTSDQANALGYHDVTPDGLPVGKVFAKSDLDIGSQWTVTASHELLEILGDPEINLTVFVQPDGHSGVLYAYEVCDACQDDQFGYEINGTAVSDFVFPAWFQPSRPAGTQFDFQRKITAPLQILAGGYIQFLDVTASTGWQQKTAQGVPYTWQDRARVGSRRERRRTPRNHWLRSTAHHPKRPGTVQSD